MRQVIVLRQLNLSLWNKVSGLFSGAFTVDDRLRKTRPVLVYGDFGTV